MNVLIDIGHPAHVHYFKNLIFSLKKQNNHFIIIARDKDVTHQLLKNLKIEYISRGSGARSLVGKIFYTFYANYKILISAIKFKPDIFVSFASIYAGQAAFILNKPHITFTDTEHAVLANSLLLPFSKIITTPSSFKKNFGIKHKRFDGFFELCYLHPDYYKPNKKSLRALKLLKNEKYVLLRFVSWNATHDIGYAGLNIDAKRYLVNTLSQHVRVFISSEEKLPNDLLKYEINIPPDKLHDIIAFSSYVIGESGTIATESAILGKPSILFSSVSDNTFGNFYELEHKYGLLKKYEKFNNDIVDKIISNINSKDYYELITKNKNKLLSEKIDVNEFIIKLIESYSK